MPTELTSVLWFWQIVIMKFVVHYEPPYAENDKYGNESRTVDKLFIVPSYSVKFNKYFNKKFINR